MAIFNTINNQIAEPMVFEGEPWDELEFSVLNYGRHVHFYTNGHSKVVVTPIFESLAVLSSRELTLDENITTKHIKEWVITLERLNPWVATEPYDSEVFKICSFPSNKCCSMINFILTNFNIKS